MSGCRHCGKPPEQDGDHSCPCPHSDDACPDHPVSERTRLIREQQRDTTEEVTAVMVSGDTEGRTPSRSVEQDSRGEWHWFCLRDGCNWSGMGLLSEDGANREADRHDKEFHP